MADGKFAIIGLGQFGTSVAKNLSKLGAEVMAIDREIERVDIVKDDVAYAVALDSTDIKALKAQSIHEMDAVLLAIGENVEGLLLTTVLLLELKVKRIIARAVSEQQKIILQKLGVSEIILPEDEVGKMTAEMLLNPEIQSFMTLPDSYEIVEVIVPRRLYGKYLEDLDIEATFNADIIALRRLFEERNALGVTEYKEHLIRNPKDVKSVLQKGDKLVMLATKKSIKQFLEINS
ncbi:TrkA family potassium uptake protein [Flammeovirga sp. SJP92]|uniref:potassium channel family protein n=1 Tax=Flammeovirga sp. SJP92 TaxID=1775430 RepID=UPI00078686F0|nr:TrkA family potassium uptake protein [Flammeovirga sp. SJP92]KXX68695.1 potassium transporter KtrA [Flammeovirga sp. SJP92]